MKSSEALAVLMVVAGGLWVIGCGGGGGASSQYPLSVNRLHSLNLSLLEYVNDYDEVLPLPANWADGLMPYAKDATLFHSPAVSTKGYGYALNSAVAGKVASQFPDPATEVTLFDSTDLSRNATEPTSTEPSPPRYGSHNTIGYLDGHVQDYNSVNSVPLYTQSKQNLKSLALGALMYGNDYDGVSPLTGQWMDELLPYVKNDALFHSPALVTKNRTQYGYAFNSAITDTLLANLPAPATTLMIFDSTVLTRNATAPASTLPSPPRYGTENTIAYADGHVHP